MCNNFELVLLWGSYHNTLAYDFQASLSRWFIINSRISVFHFQTNKPSNYVIVMKQGFTFAETIRFTTLRAAGCLTTIYIVLLPGPDPCTCICFLFLFVFFFWLNLYLFIVFICICTCYLLAFVLVAWPLSIFALLLDSDLSFCAAVFRLCTLYHLFFYIS